MHARNKAEQGVGVAADQGQIVDLHIGYGRSERCIAEIDQWHIGCNVDRLALAANLQHQIQCGALHNGENDTAAIQCLEASSDHGNFVGAYGEKLLMKGAVSLGNGDPDEIRVGLG